MKVFRCHDLPDKPLTRHREWEVLKARYPQIAKEIKQSVVRERKGFGSHSQKRIIAPDQQRAEDRARLRAMVTGGADL